MRPLSRTITILLLALVPTLVLAATPTAINYQGQLTNGTGTPVPDASYSVVFTIWPVPAGGTPIWAETLSVATSGGLFAVILGIAHPMVDTVFSGVTRYLGTQVGTDPEIIPRTMLASVAYAQRISTVDGSSGGAISGNVTLENSTTTAGNIYKGTDLFIHNSGSDNTFIGQSAGNLTMAGIENTATGSGALQSNSTGFNNTATGYGALSTSNGNHNTATGNRALQNNTLGASNTAVGSEALRFNITGSSNTASGFLALHNNNADHNTATGNLALEANTTGSANTAIGSEALLLNITGSSNTASGFLALHNNNADHNTATGNLALEANTTGSANTAIGSEALLLNITGSSNTASGFLALHNNNADHNTATGNLALEANTTGSANTAIGSEALLLNTTGNSSTATGVFALQQNNGDNNTANGYKALELNTSGTENTAVGRNALAGNTTGNNNTALGFGADVSTGNLTNATAVGNGAIVDASNKIRLGDGNVTVIEGQVAYTFTSDKNQKENFEPVNGDEVLQKIEALNLTSWNYKGQDPQQFRHYGPVAQEFFAAFGHDGKGTSGTPTTINSGDMAGIMMIAIQTLEKRTAEIEKLKTENAKLKARLETTLLELQAEMAMLRKELGK